MYDTNPYRSPQHASVDPGPQLQPTSWSQLTGCAGLWLIVCGCAYGLIMTTVPLIISIIDGIDLAPTFLEGVINAAIWLGNAAIGVASLWLGRKLRRVSYAAMRRHPSG